MPRVRESEFVTFNDGVLDICELSNRTIVGTKIEKIRFGKRTVGINRFWNAKIDASMIDAVVAIPQIGGITTRNICVMNGQQYKIKQVQDKFDQYPPHLLLSLERNQVEYKDVREHEN